MCTPCRCPASQRVGREAANVLHEPCLVRTSQQKSPRGLRVFQAESRNCSAGEVADHQIQTLQALALTTMASTAMTKCPKYLRVMPVVDSVAHVSVRRVENVPPVAIASHPRPDNFLCITVTLCDVLCHSTPRIALTRDT